jgi:DDE superfamily endonuclease
MHPFIIAQCLLAMGVPRPTQKFVTELLALWLTVRGRFNFVNLGRYSSFCERTLRRGFARGFCWSEFNGRLLTIIIPAHHELIAVLDASFVKKSGKCTAGLGFFFNGCAGRAEKGLELSLLSIGDVTANTAYALSAQQTIAGEESKKAGHKATGHKATGHKATGHKATAAETRIDAYVRQVKRMRSLLPLKVRHLAVDGYYTCRKFVDGVCDLDLHVVGKLRKDASLVYPYDGPQKRRGRRRLYGERVQWLNLDQSHWQDEGEAEKGVQLQSAVLHHRTLGRLVRVALLQQQRRQGVSQVLLFSTDLSLSGWDVVRFYRARFQIEFLFRDAKGSMGLSHCQARSTRALEFHWNAAFCALNVAKWQETQRCQTRRFSAASCKQRCSNQRLLEVFSYRLGLDWISVKSHPAYQELCNYGAITP